MDRDTPEGRAHAFQQMVASTTCDASRRNARVRLQLIENRLGAASSRGRIFTTVLADRLRQAGMRVMSQGSTDYVVHGTITSQVNANRLLALNEISVNAVITLASAKGQTVSSQISREESYAGADLQSAYIDLIQGQASDVAGKLFADLCQPTGTNHPAHSSSTHLSKL